MAVAEAVEQQHRAAQPWQQIVSGKGWGNQQQRLEEMTPMFF